MAIANILYTAFILFSFLRISGTHTVEWILRRMRYTKSIRQDESELSHYNQYTNNNNNNNTDDDDRDEDTKECNYNNCLYSLGTCFFAAPTMTSSRLFDDVV